MLELKIFRYFNIYIYIFFCSWVDNIKLWEKKGWEIRRELPHSSNEAGVCRVLERAVGVPACERAGRPVNGFNRAEMGPTTPTTNRHLSVLELTGVRPSTRISADTRRGPSGRKRQQCREKSRIIMGLLDRTGQSNWKRVLLLTCINCTVTIVHFQKNQNGAAPRSFLSVCYGGVPFTVGWPS